MAVTCGRRLTGYLHEMGPSFVALPLSWSLRPEFGGAGSVRPGSSSEAVTFVLFSPLPLPLSQFSLPSLVTSCLPFLFSDHGSNAQRHEPETLQKHKIEEAEPPAIKLPRNNYHHQVSVFSFTMRAHTNILFSFENKNQALWCILCLSRLVFSL